MNNIVLGGFMGTGKSALGKLVAHKLERRFVDMDATIEAQAGKPITRIFAEDGEAAFRKMEADLCRDLSQEQNLVIACGGGTLIDAQNRALLQARGLLICLEAAPEVILERVGGDAQRPLLNVVDPVAEIRRLLEQRSAAYRDIPWHIDSGTLTPDDAATRSIALSEMRILPVRHPAGNYLIYVGSGLLAHLGDVLLDSDVPAGSRVAVVTNTVVGPLYAARAEAALEQAGFSTWRCTLPDGEAHKNLDTVAGLYKQLLAGKLDRSGTVLALGGGVSGDMAGFAAATFMRGMRFIQVPTSLLAMTDASVGGKTGVDLPQGKNLVGAFKQPHAVVIDPSVLETLPQEEFYSGMAEMIKHGVIGAPDLFADLAAAAKHGEQQIGAELVARSLRVKIAIVEEDPYEKGRRAVLNLGHTVGHALEQLSNYSLRHGEGVSIGMVAAAKIAAAMDLAPATLAKEIADLLTAWHLPVELPPCAPEEIYAAMTHDKKRQGKALRWILPRAIGNVEICAHVPEELVKAVLTQ